MALACHTYLFNVSLLNLFFTNFYMITTKLFISDTLLYKIKPIIHLIQHVAVIKTFRSL